MKKILVLITILITLTGCYNYRELNDLAIVSAISISKSDNEYNVVIQVVNPKKEQDTSSSNEPDFITFKSSGKSLHEAFRLIIKESPKKIYGTQMQILLLDENVAKSNISEILDFFARDPEIRKEFYVLISKDEDILEILTPLDNISSQNILDSLKANNRYLGYANLVTFNDLIASYQNDRIELALPSLYKTGNEETGAKEENLETAKTDSSIYIGSLGIFKDNKLVGYLTEKESLAYNLVMNNVTNALITNEYKDDKYIVTELIKTKTELEPVAKDNKIKIKVTGKSSITEVNYKDLDLRKEKNIKKIEKDLNKNIEKLIKDSIKSIIEEYDSDIFGFEDLFYKENNKYYKKIKDDWDSEILKNLKIEVDSKLEIVEQGNILGGIKNGQ